MKKLKIQTALLAICLALATTLTINNEINARGNDPGARNLPNQHNSNDKGHKEQTKQKTTFLQTIDKYLMERKVKEPLTKQKYIDILREYIGNDINKYLALIILAAQVQIPIFDEDLDQLYNLLLNDPLEDRKEVHIIKDDDKNKKLSQYLKSIRDIIRTDAGTKTKEGQILRSFFSVDLDHPIAPLFDNQDQMQELIHAYQDDEKTKVNTFYSQLISFLGPVAEQLQLEADYAREEGEQYTSFHIIYQNRTLGPLAQLVRDFSEAYKNKLEKLKKLEQQQQTTQPLNDKSDDTDIKQIEQLIRKWIKQKEKTNTDKEAKLQQLEQAINSLERKYKKIVKENEGKLR